MDTSTESKTMYHDCHCEWCTTPTLLKENYAIKLPCYIRFGQGKDTEQSVIACLYHISGEHTKVIFPDGSNFGNLTSAGKYAHSKLLQKTSSEGNNGWKRWRINMKFLDGTEKPVVLKTLRDANISIENGDSDFLNISFKSKFCRCANEKVATKTIMNMLVKQPVSIKRKQLNNVVGQLTKKKKSDDIPKKIEDMDVEEFEEDEDTDLDNFVVDVSKMPGDRYYNDIVYGRKHIYFSHIDEDVEDDNYFLCTIRDEFVNLRIPKSVLLALYQYRKCDILKRFR